MPRVDVVEVLWLSIALFGVAGSLWNLSDAWRDWRAVRAVPRLVTVARWGFRAEGFRLLTMACFALAGVGAFLDWHRIVVIGFLIGGSGMLALNSWADRLDRRRALDALHRRRP
jgi:hypothetical protein